MPSLSHARITRRAIAPRLATSSLRNGPDIPSLNVPGGAFHQAVQQLGPGLDKTSQAARRRSGGGKSRIGSSGHDFRDGGSFRGRQRQPKHIRERTSAVIGRFTQRLCAQGLLEQQPGSLGARFLHEQLNGLHKHPPTQHIGQVA